MVNKLVNKCSAGKENVSLTLEVIHETTITAAQSSASELLFYSFV